MRIITVITTLLVSCVAILRINVVEEKSKSLMSNFSDVEFEKRRYSKSIESKVFIFFAIEKKMNLVSIYSTYK